MDDSHDSPLHAACVAMCEDRMAPAIQVYPTAERTVPLDEGELKTLIADIATCIAQASPEGLATDFL
jgi:hypothetical protein